MYDINVVSTVGVLSVHPSNIVIEITITKTTQKYNDFLIVNIIFVLLHLQK